MAGTSLLRRMRWSFLWLFVISVPMWWFFEYMNSIVQNWHYVFAHPISILQTLKISPAMAAGVTKRLWEMGDIVDVLEAWEQTSKSA